MKLQIKTVLISALLSGLVAQPLYAGETCKGQSETSCASQQSCNWVQGYERKDGISVKAHCRISRKSSTSNRSDQPTAQLNKEF